MLTVLLGGARSGKSSLAVRMAIQSGLPVTFIATAEPRDEEMAERIARHRAERPLSFATVEEPLELGHAMETVDPSHAVVVDCLTLWVSNLFAKKRRPGEIEELAVEAAGVAAGREGPTVVVSNEVGCGIVPLSEMARSYRDVLGTVNTVFATRADAAYLVVAGRTMVLSAPVL